MNLAMLVPSALAVLAGMLFPTQTAINAELAVGVGGPIVATTVSFATGLVALVMLTWVSTVGSPDWTAIRHTTPWLLVAGGLLGAIYLCLNILLVPRIGSGAMMASAVAGQMLAALIIDANGLFGLTTHVVSPGRVAGAALVLVGALTVRFL